MKGLAVATSIVLAAAAPLGATTLPFDAENSYGNHTLAGLSFATEISEIPTSLELLAIFQPGNAMRPSSGLGIPFAELLALSLASDGVGTERSGNFLKSVTRTQPNVQIGFFYSDPLGAFYHRVAGPGVGVRQAVFGHGGSGHTLSSVILMHDPGSSPVIYSFLGIEFGEEIEAVSIEVGTADYSLFEDMAIGGSTSDPSPVPGPGSLPLVATTLVLLGLVSLTRIQGRPERLRSVAAN